jgi:16S rRNA (adenine1518-N6/adenine1519-N6)-dimethyltransferase
MTRPSDSPAQDPAALPPLRDVIAAHDLRARKALGQNFLLDTNLTAKIARAAGPLDGATVLEVGPGPGGLTRALLDAGARRVVAIERDERCLAALAPLARHYGDRLILVGGDALAADEVGLIGTDPGPVAIVANLPYNVASALLVKWLTAPAWPPFFTAMTLMFQKEVAERIVAPPGGKAYGRLSVLSQWRTVPRRLFDLPPRAFTPPPKVTSSVVGFTVRADPLPAPLPALERVVAAAFGQRRKMLRQSLRALGPDAEGLVAAAGLDPTQRAETVPVAGFCALARAYDTARALSRGGGMG